MTNETRERGRSARRVGAQHIVGILGVMAAAAVPLVVLRGAPGERSGQGAVVLDEGGALPATVRADVEASAAFDCRPVRTDERVAGDHYPVPRPPFSEDVFPCTRCHDNPDDFNTTKRTLTLQHWEIELVHGPREQWCYGCHNPTDRDTLRLAGGRTVGFHESYELCGQCHGPKLRDWRLGIHGRRIGCWNGRREYLLCVHCHDPHAPRFPLLEPLPAPRRPSDS